MFKKILIANRGEIALRIVRACKEMGIETVVVHSTADANGMAVRMADESVCIGPAPSRQSYLNIPAILTAASVTNVDAIHPGIGFLSENEEFCRMVEEHGFTFIGPSPEHIAKMGDKAAAKDTMRALGLPLVPGSPGVVGGAEEGLKIAQECGFPVLIKAAAGGGGDAGDDEQAARWSARAWAMREAALWLQAAANRSRLPWEPPRHEA